MHEQMKFTKEEKLTGDSHFRSSERYCNRRKKKEDAKANGICKKLIDQEYERKKAQIIVHLELLMELLQRNKDQRHGWNMRKKVRWKRPHTKREK